MAMSQLDQGQIIKTVFDEAAGALKVEVVSGAGTSTAINDGVDNTLKATVTAANAIKVDGSATTQPVSAASLPLPTGASSAANQTNGNQKSQVVDGSGNVIGSTANALDINIKSSSGSVTVVQPTGTNLHTVIDSGTVAATQSGTWTIQPGNTANTTPWLATISQGGNSASVSASNALKVDGSAAIQPVSAASLPLPTGAATSAKQPALGTAGTASADVITVQGIASMTALKVDGSASTQPVSGTVTANIGTTNGLALDSSISSSQPRKLQDGAGNAVTSQVNGSQRALDVGVNVAGVQVDPRSIRALTSSDVVSAAQSGTWNINNVSGTVSLPTGASISAKQPALGTAGTASADVITVQGIASMTALKVDGSAVTQPVSGTVTANAGTGSFTVAQATGTNLHTVVDSGTVAATQSGNWSTRTQDGSGTAITSTGSALDVNLKTSAITINTSESPYTLVEFVRNDYTSTAVTTGAYVQIIASTANAYKEIHIFDSSGQTLKLATGGSGSEVDKLIIPPGGTFPIKLSIASGTRVSLKAVSATASVGEINVQLLG